MSKKQVVDNGAEQFGVSAAAGRSKRLADEKLLEIGLAGLESGELFGVVGQSLRGKGGEGVRVSDLIQIASSNEVQDSRRVLVNEIREKLFGGSARQGALVKKREQLGELDWGQTRVDEATIRLVQDAGDISQEPGRSFLRLCAVADGLFEKVNLRGSDEAYM